MSGTVRTEKALSYLPGGFAIAATDGLLVGVGCEIVFMPLLATDINHGSAFSNDNRAGEPPYGPRYRFFRRAEYDRARGGRGPGYNIL